MKKSMGSGLFVLSSLSLLAQPVCINAGGAMMLNNDGSTSCYSDINFLVPPILSFTYTDSAMGPAEFATLRYGTSFSYLVPTYPGFYTITVDFVEPNKTAAAQRLFTVSINGNSSQNIDVFQLAGGKLFPYTLRLFAISNGTIRIDFKGVIGNAIVNRIYIRPADALDVFPILNAQALVNQEWRMLVRPAFDLCATLSPTNRIASLQKCN